MDPIQTRPVPPQAVELLKTRCQLPDLLLDPWEKRWRTFASTNGLQPDPLRDLEEDRAVKAWSEVERQLFMEKFLQVGTKSLSNPGHISWRLVGQRWVGVKVDGRTEVKAGSTLKPSGQAVMKL